MKEKLNYYYYLPSDGVKDRGICHYMRLDYLIQLLETRQFHVTRRREFDDANESYESIKLAYPIAPAKDYGNSNQELPDRLIPYFDIVHCPTSCWTKNTEESIFMWKLYASEVGACIKSTVHNLVASLKLDLKPDGGNIVICGSMNYKNDLIPSSDEEGQLFNKDYAYEAEDEFRFYFHLSNDTDKKNTKYCLIPVNTAVMIDEILLSPFICKDAANKLARMIKCCYGIENVKLSNIKLK